MKTCVTLTGALGLVGSEFLRRLIAWEPHLKIYLLCRSKNQRTPLQRLQHLFPDFPRHRIQIFETALDQPQLGLSPSQYAELVKNTTDIFHFASTVQFDLPLSIARTLNVQSTEQLLQLAVDCQKKGNFKHFHYLSTYATAYIPHSTLALELPSTVQRAFRNTYEQTKVEAEQLLYQKSNQLPISIYRPSIICGDSRTGWTSKFDVFYTPLKIIFEKMEDYPAGFFIPERGKLDIVTLDFVSDSIYILWKKSNSTVNLSIYHLTSGQQTLPLFEAIHTGAENFPDIKKRLVPILELNELQLVQILKHQSHRSALLSEVLKNLAPYLFDPCIYDHQQLLKKLAGTSVRPLPILSIIPKLLEFCFQSQWGKINLPRPPLGPPPIYSYDTEPIAVLGTHSISLQSAAFSFEGKSFRIPPKTAKGMDVLQKAVLIATQSALKQAGYNTTLPPALAHETGMILGYGSEQSAMDALLTQRLAWSVYKKEHEGLDPKKLEFLEKELLGNTPDLQEDALAGSLPNVSLGHVTSFFDLHGGTYVLSAQTNAQFLALDHAIEHLQTQECSMMIVGALDSDQSLLEILILKPLTAALKNKDLIQGVIQQDWQQDWPQDWQKDWQKNLQGNTESDFATRTVPPSLLSWIKPLPQSEAEAEYQVSVEPLSDHFYEPIAITSAHSILPGAEAPNSLWPLLLSGMNPTQEVQHNTSINNHHLFFSTAPDLAPNQTYSIKAALLTQPTSHPTHIDPIHHHFSTVFAETKNALNLNQTPDQTELITTEFIIGESKSGSYVNWHYFHQSMLQRIENTNTSPQSYPHFSRHLAQLVNNHFRELPDSTHPPLAYSIDAACASSLAALAVSVRRLRLHKIDQALSGGVGISVSLANLIPFAQCHALAKQKSQPFDKNSDGITLGEGVVTFVLKRLKDAKRNNDPILGLILGIGASSDGKGKSMMAPSAEGQALAIQRAFAQTGHPELAWHQRIQFVECHATGTPTGDASEVEALSNIYLTAERSEPLRIGSIKSQIGHTIGAAGSAGLLKILLGFEKKTYPPQSPLAHTDQIPMSSQLHIQTTPDPWPLRPGESQRFAGVSAFGFGGTNWHAIVASPAAAEIQHQAPWKKLGTTSIQKNIPRMAFLFPGHGAPYPDMGLEFYQHFPIFRSVFRITNEVLAAVLPHFSIESAIFSHLTPRSQIIENLKRPDFVQPILLTVSIAFYQLLRELGLKPSVVVGHSVGEFAAAVASGMISFEEALLATYKRGKIYRDAQQKSIDTGSMAAVFTSHSELLKILPTSLQIAAFNAPKQNVISGPTPQLLAFLESLSAQSISAKLLDISVAWHSSLADQLGHDLAQDAFSQLTLAEPHVPLLSSVNATYYESKKSQTGAHEHPLVTQLVRQLGVPTLWSACLERLRQDHIQTFIDVGPGKILGSLLSKSDWSKSDSNLRSFAIDSPENTTAESLRHFVQTLQNSNARSIAPSHKLKTTSSPPLSVSISPQSIELLLKIAADKTGYTPEQLSLDAHLEADLGIDSIKQIQILSEFKKQWGTPTSLGSSPLGFQLRDFPTFRHWLQLVHTTTEAAKTTTTGTHSLPRSFFLERLTQSEIPETLSTLSLIRSITVASLLLSFGLPSLGLLNIGIIQDSFGVAKDLQLQFEIDAIPVTLIDPHTIHCEEMSSFQTIIYLTPLGELLNNSSDDSNAHERSILELLPFLQKQQTSLKNFIAIRALRSEELEIDGALSGFVRTLFHEWTHCKMQLIHTSRKLSQEEPEKIAKWLYSEIMSAWIARSQTPLGTPSHAPRLLLSEIVLNPHPGSPIPLRSRILHQAIPSSTRTQSQRGHSPTSFEPTLFKPTFLRKEALLLITGGLGGIVVPILKQVLRFFSPKILILGRSPLQNTRVQKQLLELRHLHPKKKIDYLQWDLSSTSSSTEIIADHLDRSIETDLDTHILKNFGHLDGIIHAAGIVDDQKIEHKTIQSFQKVYAVKVQGMRLLTDLALKTQVQFFCVFSSIAAEYGNPGQIDYAAGNAAITAMLTSLQHKRPTLKCLSVAWGPWAQVGMAAQESVSTLLALAGSGLITPTEGSIAFLNEVLYVAAHHLVRPHCVMIQPSPISESPVTAPSPHELLPKEIQPYLDEILFYEPHHFLLAQKNLNLKTDPWLIDHQIKNIPILPATFGIEIMTQAAMTLCYESHSPWKWKLSRIEQLEILAPIFIPSEKQIRIRASLVQTSVQAPLLSIPATVHTIVSPNSSRRTSKREIWVQIEQHTQGQWSLAYQGWVILKSRLRPHAVQNSEPLPDTAPKPLSHQQIYHSPKSIPLGPKFHILSGFQSVSSTAAIGRFEKSGEISKFLSSPILREAAFHTAALLRMNQSDEILIPRSIQSLIFYPSTRHPSTGHPTARTHTSQKEKVFQIKVIDKKEEGFDSLVLDGKLCPRLEIRCLQMLDARDLF